MYSANLCGNYEFELVRIKLYDFSRLFYVTKRVKKYANVAAVSYTHLDVYKRQVYKQRYVKKKPE